MKFTALEAFFTLMIPPITDFLKGWVGLRWVGVGIPTTSPSPGDLGEVVVDVYGWEWPFSDEEILERLLALNLEQAGQAEQTHSAGGS